MDTVQQRIAVVTGASRGIGFEVARQLSGLGVHVVVTSRDAAAGEAAAQSITAQGNSASVCVLDVTDDASCAALGGHIRKTYGRLDVLVNNAGVALDKWQPALDVCVQAMRQTYETNVFGVMRVCKALVPLMIEGGYGRVVNVSSSLGSLDKMGGFSVAYRSSKTALNALTRVLAEELKHDDVLINAMCPGWVRTDLGGPDAPRSPVEAADTAVWLATLPPGGPSGGFFMDRQPLSW